MFERFSDKARRVVVLAQEESRILGHDVIDTEHLLLGLLGVTDGVAARVLNDDFSITLNNTRQQLQSPDEKGRRSPSGHIPFTPSSKKVLEMSLRESVQLGHDGVTERHILLALARTGEGLGADILKAGGAGIAELERRFGELEMTDEERSDSGPVGRAPVDDSRLVEARARLSDDGEAVLRRALAETITQRAPSIELRHFLVAIVTELDQEAVAALGEAIDGSSVDVDQLRSALGGFG